MVIGLLPLTREEFYIILGQVQYLQLQAKVSHDIDAEKVTNHQKSQDQQYTCNLNNGIIIAS